MKAPRLLKNESAASFRTRVEMWEKRTGKKYPKSGWGTREERALSNRIKLGNFGQSNQLDYSKDYNLDDEAKELSLDPSNNKRWRESEEGEKFARQELAIQEAIDQDKKEDFALKASKGLNIDTSQVDNAIDTLDKLKNKETLTIPKEVDNSSKGESEKVSISESKSKDSGNNSNFKSDVFTINPETGKAVGVLTRSQRRAFEKKNQAALEKAVKDKLKIRTYRNKGDSYKRYG